MKKTYQISNVSCQNCANIIKASLGDEFQILEINLNINPREITVEIDDEQLETKFKEEIKDLGYEIIKEV